MRAVNEHYLKLILETARVFLVDRLGLQGALPNPVNVLQVDIVTAVMAARTCDDDLGVQLQGQKRGKKIHVM